VRFLLAPTGSNPGTSLRGQDLHLCSEVMGPFYGAILVGECNAITSRTL
jgi:hypothetical protein